jgi:hypothetical protein
MIRAAVFTPELETKPLNSNFTCFWSSHDTDCIRRKFVWKFRLEDSKFHVDRFVDCWYLNRMCHPLSFAVLFTQKF